MKGWFSTDVYQVINAINQHGKLKVIDGTDLVVETNDLAEMESLTKSLSETFGKEVWIELIVKTRLE